MKRVMPWWLLIVLVLYGSTSARAQTTLNLSQDLVTLGIAATNMVPNQPLQDAGPLLVQGVAYAQRQGIPLVIANPGAYYFLSLQNPNWHVQLVGLNNLTIDLQHSDLIFTQTYAAALYLGFNTGVTFQNFTIDYQPLPFTQARVVSVNPATAQIQYGVQPGWPDPSTFNTAPAGTIFQVHIFRNGRPAYGTARMAAQSPISGNLITLIAYDTVPTAQSMAMIRPGDVAVVAMRTNLSTVITDRCISCTLRNITVYSGTNAAVQTTFSSSSTLERVYMIPKPGTDRLVSALGINSIHPGPNSSIRLSRAIGSMDDAFGLFGHVTGLVQTQPSSRTLTVAGIANTTLNWLVSVPDGSPVAFERPVDGALLASATVGSQVAGSTSVQPYLVTYTFDNDLPSGLVGSYMYSTDANLRGANSVVERNLAQSNAAGGNGLDVGGWASGSTFNGNYLRRNSWTAIMANQHLEDNCCDDKSEPLANVTFSNNVMDGANLSPSRNYWFFALGAMQVSTLRTNPGNPDTLMPGSPHQNITIANNFVADAGRSAVWFGNTAGGSVTGNYLLNAGNRPDLSDVDPAHLANATTPLVIDSTSSGITTSNNTIDTTSGVLFVTDQSSRELAAYAPGGTIRLNAYNIGSLASPTLTLTDADGVVAPVAVHSTSAHALDVQLPSGAALGGAYITLTSGGAKYFGTLFVDSQDNIPALNGCVYEASLSSAAVAATASNVSVLVVTQAGCGYQVTDADTFVTGAAGVGTGVIAVAFAANPGGTRTTTVEVAGQPFTITQGGAAPSITTQPTSQTVAPSQPFSLSVVAIGPAPLSYQWYAGASGDTSQPVPSSGSTYSATASATCCFWVRVSNAGGHADSATAAITVGTGATTTPGPGVGANLGGSPGGDAFLYKPSAGTWSMQLSSAASFVGINAGAWAANWTIQAGDFNGDGLTDLFLYNSTTGQWFKVINLGGGTFSYVGGTWAPNWTITLLDFDGDGKTDVFLYNQTSGHWFRAMSVGAGDFSYFSGAWAPGWSLYPADFNGDGRADLFLYNHNATSDPNHGLWFRVMTQADGSFTYLPGDVRWANTWTVTPADLNGDGLTDLFIYNATNGQYFRVLFVNGVATYTGGVWGANWTISKGDFNGDGRADLFLYNKTNGMWFVVISNPDGTLGYFGGQWAANWDVTVTDFDADGRSDILLYNATTGQWFQALTVTPGTFSFTTGNWGTGWNAIARRTIVP